MGASVSGTQGGRLEQGIGAGGTSVHGGAEPPGSGPAPCVLEHQQPGLCVMLGSDHTRPGTLCRRCSPGVSDGEEASWGLQA